MPLSAYALKPVFQDRGSFKEDTENLLYILLPYQRGAWDLRLQHTHVYSPSQPTWCTSAAVSDHAAKQVQKHVQSFRDLFEPHKSPIIILKSFVDFLLFKYVWSTKSIWSFVCVLCFCFWIFPHFQQYLSPFRVEYLSMHTVPWKSWFYQFTVHIHVLVLISWTQY